MEPRREPGPPWLPAARPVPPPPVPIPPGPPPGDPPGSIAPLLVLRLMRLDGPLRGWDIPLAGLAVVIGLMLSTSPWAWALAGSIGVLLAGLAQLPWWRLAAGGAGVW